MTPTITAIFAAIVALIYLAMSAYVITMRAKTNVLLGDGGNPSMLLAMRRHGNMAEYAPFAILMMGLAEMLGLEALWLHISGTLLVVGRLLHPIGLHIAEGNVAPRIAGTLSTLAAILVPSVGILMLTLA